MRAPSNKKNLSASMAVVPLLKNRSGIASNDQSIWKKPRGMTVMGLPSLPLRGRSFAHAPERPYPASQLARCSDVCDHRSLAQLAR